MNESDILGARRAIFAWLWLLIGLVFCMVVVGGVTRLTGSGLSIVEWAPIMGTLPPLNDHDWMAAFEQYKQYPQYRITHPDMSLAGFQGIFFWEFFIYVLEGMVFLITGLQARTILSRIGDYPLSQLALSALVITAAVIVSCG